MYVQYVYEDVDGGQDRGGGVIMYTTGSWEGDTKTYDAGNFERVFA